MAESNSPSTSSSSADELDYQLEQSIWSLEQLKTAAIEQRILRPRTLAWAIMLHAVPPPNGDIVASIKAHRKFYSDLKAKLFMDPRTVIGDDPLSQSDESAWKQHFCDNELKNLILQDVVRTFPDELYFREKIVQDVMVCVLFHWARTHKHVGYRQGMHEILAPLLFELYLDRNFAPRGISEKLKYILEEEYMEHDSYMLFSAVMKGLEKYYTTGDVAPSSCGRLPSSRTVHNPNEVVRYLEYVKEEYLVPLDPELATHMATANISMELFGIRWLRLLFGREFPRSEIPHLWGFLFADGPTFPNLHFVVIAILISMRTTLLDSDPGVVLSALMRPSRVSARHVIAHALHLRTPQLYALPPTPVPTEPDQHSPENYSIAASSDGWWERERDGDMESGSEGVAEGADVARSLAALGVLRARLPAAAAALAAALPRPNERVRRPLMQILQLAALLQCRNHELIDVETALEADEGPTTDLVGRKQILPVVIAGRRHTNRPTNKLPNIIKEVPLTVFHQGECQSAKGFPCLDPLKLRTE